MAHQLKVAVIVRPDYVVSYEQWDDLTFGHVDVHRWSPRVARQLLEDVSAAFALRNTPIHALGTTGDTKHAKFMALLGFTPCGSAFNVSGDPALLYVRNP